MIIGITGRINSGKDTVANYLTTAHGFTRMSYAGPLKDAVSAIFGWDRIMLEGTTKESRMWRDQVDTWWAERLNIPNLTPRWILQQWGTEVGRRAFHDDIWIASIENKIRQLSSQNIVISDCRFANELKAIKNVGGKTIRVERGSNPSWYHAANIYNKGPNFPDYQTAEKYLKDHGIHASEYSSVGLEYDYIIDNDGTIDELHKQINSIINA